jgi:hypothetical protein
MRCLVIVLALADLFDAGLLDEISHRDLEDTERGRVPVRRYIEMGAVTAIGAQPRAADR